MTQLISNKRTLLVVYLASFLYSFHYALPLYIESSFISQFLTTTKTIGLIFSIAAILTAIFTFFLPNLLRRFGNYNITLATMILEIGTLIALATLSIFLPNLFFVIVFFFILHQTLTNVIFLNLDNFVEYFSDNSKTGGIRGIFMTVLNVAITIAPLVAGLILTDHDFWKIYLVAALFMFFGLLIIAKYFQNYTDPVYTIPRFKETFEIVKRSHDLHSIIYLHFLLSFFYAWMIIYTPIYLNTHMGISMSEILSIIIPVSLIPFILFEVILGKIADNKLGEKEILTIGFIIMAISTASLSWIVSASVALWAGVLFLTRTGASAVEVMTESYFYKQIGPSDVHLITFMRTIRTVAYIIGPLLGSLALVFVQEQYLFVILGIILLTALPYSLSIKDTR